MTTQPEVSQVRLNLAIALSQMFRDSVEDYHAAPNTLRTGLTDPEMHQMNRRTSQRALDLLYSVPKLDFERDGVFAAAQLLDAAFLSYPNRGRFHLTSEELMEIFRRAVRSFDSDFERRAAYYLQRRVHSALDRDFTPMRLSVLTPATWQLIESISDDLLKSARRTWTRTRRSKRWREFPNLF